MGFELAFIQHFWSEILAGFHPNRYDDLNSDSDVESEFDLYQKLVKFNWNWSIMTGFRHFQRCFWYKLTFNGLLQSFNRLFPSFNQIFRSFYRSFNPIRLNLDRKRSILYRNCDRQFGFVVGFRIGLKLMIELRHGFWFDDDDSIRFP